MGLEMLSARTSRPILNSTSSIGPHAHRVLEKKHQVLASGEKVVK
jgi:hypothetical protein